MANDVFIICTKPGELSLMQKEDSKSNLIEKCKLVNRQDVLERIDISDERNLPIHLHNSCRVAIYNKARGILSRNEENMKSHPSNVDKQKIEKEQSFQWKTNCYICTFPCSTDPKISNRKEQVWSRCEPSATKNKVLELLNDKTDEKSMGIKARLLSCHDLPAVEACYHHLCAKKLSLSKENLSSPPTFIQSVM